MTIATAASPSVSSFARRGDITVCVTYRPDDPTWLTDVVIEPDPAGDPALLQIIDETMQRLRVFAGGYRDAMADDGAPIPLPVRWHGTPR